MTRASNSEYSALLGVMLDAAESGATIIRDGATRRSSLSWEAKGPADYLTEIDRGSEERILATLTQHYPNAQFLAEETWQGNTIASGLSFVIDPLDGTTNFLHGVPEYAVSIGALMDGVPVAGVVLNAAHDETFTATRGGGAFRNGDRIGVSTITAPARALIATGFPFNGNADIGQYASQFSAVALHTAGIRRAGSAALDFASVAMGRFDAFWELSLHPWDIAAGLLLIREAGGVVTDLDGRDSRIEARPAPFVAGNPTMHTWLLRTLHSARINK